MTEENMNHWDEPIIRACKAIIASLVRQKRYDDAAFTAHNPIHTKDGEVYMFLVARLGNVGVTKEQEKELDQYCTTLGFNAERQRIEWDQNNYKRILEEYENSALKREVKKKSEPAKEGVDYLY